MSSRGGWSRLPGASGLGLTAGAWLASVVRGVAGLGGAGARPPAGLIGSPAVLGLAVGLGDPWAYCRGVVVLGCAAGAWVPVGLLLGLVVIHPVR